ncbi:hypothetical protein BH23GEM11_BH23GEM11_02160 [soil metagenome]
MHGGKWFLQAIQAFQAFQASVGRIVKARWNALGGDGMGDWDCPG